VSPRRIVIVGAGPAGLATARAHREHGGTGEVTLLGKETLIPYRRPPLTKEFLRGELDAGELPIQSQDWFDESRLDEHGEGAFTVWYSHQGKLVGVLTHNRDEDYERGRQLIAAGESPP
jgi:NAD(P)H-nitrite reductase large subunit